MSNGSVTESAKKASGNLEGALWMVASGVGFTVHLTLAKLLSANYDPSWLAFVRALIALLFTAPLIIRVGPSAFRTNHLGLLVLRGLLGTFGFLLGFYAISSQFNVPLAKFNAISFSRALFVIVLAAVLLRETVGPRRWIATGIGFLGVVVMIRPDAGVDVGTLLALGAAAGMAGAIVLVKTLSKYHSPLILLTYANVLSVVLLFPFAMLNWTTPDRLMDWVLIAGMAFAGLIAQSCYITAMSKGDASFLSSMDYIRLPMTATSDWLIFHEFPGPYVWLGAAIIIASTLYITFREAETSRALATKPPHAP